MPILPYLEHTPRLEDDVFVASTAYVIGKVTVGAGSGIWFGCTVRGDTESVTIGRCVNIQECSTVHTGPSHPVVIGDNVTLGHQAVVHGAVIEDEVLIGIGASVLNGARVGRGSIIAAHALVPEGQDIPPGSLVVGVPGRILRQVTQAERDR
ncbi:MAG TPA: gamma carbonic anhydrase family protein, partial [Gemmatimonadales bacterium]